MLAARDIYYKATAYALSFAGRGQGTLHPFENTSRDELRIGLRRWIAPSRTTSESLWWRASSVSIHDDGSVTVASAAGSHRTAQQDQLQGHEVTSGHLECYVADLMGLLRAASDKLGTGDYDVRLGVESAGLLPVTIAPVRGGFWWDGQSPPIKHFVPATASVRTDVDMAALLTRCAN